jgi:hypothetical protein
MPLLPHRALTSNAKETRSKRIWCLAFYWFWTSLVHRQSRSKLGIYNCLRLSCWLLMARWLTGISWTVPVSKSGKTRSLTHLELTDWKIERSNPLLNDSFVCCLPCSLFLLPGKAYRSCKAYFVPVPMSLFGSAGMITWQYSTMTKRGHNCERCLEERACILWSTFTPGNYDVDSSSLADSVLAKEPMQQKGR